MHERRAEVISIDGYSAHADRNELRARGCGALAVPSSGPSWCTARPRRWGRWPQPPAGGGSARGARTGARVIRTTLSRPVAAPFPSRSAMNSSFATSPAPCSVWALLAAVALVAAFIVVLTTATRRRAPSRRRHRRPGRGAVQRPAVTRAAGAARSRAQDYRAGLAPVIVVFGGVGSGGHRERGDEVGRALSHGAGRAGEGEVVARGQRPLHPGESMTAVAVWGGESEGEDESSW